MHTVLILVATGALLIALLAILIVLAPKPKMPPMPPAVPGPRTSSNRKSGRGSVR